MANMRPVRPKPDWISSTISTMPCVSHSVRSLRSSSGGRGVEAAFAEHRLDDDRGHARRIHVRLEQLLERCERILHLTPW